MQLSLHKLADYAKQHKSQAVVCYIQMRSMNGQRKLVDRFRAGKIKRCCMDKDKIAGRYIRGNWPEVSRAPEPTVINWENLRVGTCNRCLRVSVSVLVSILLMAASFTVIILGKQYEQQHQE
jgi:hypothetical protein